MNNFLRYDGVPGKYVDIVKDVIYPSMAHVAADKLVRVWLPLLPVSSDDSVIDWHPIEDKGQSQRPVYGIGILRDDGYPRKFQYSRLIKK